MRQDGADCNRIEAKRKDLLAKLWTNPSTGFTGTGSVSLRTYHWDNWFGDFSYEYLKDFRAYIFILAMVYMYRFILLRLQGEAGFLSEKKDEQSDNATSDRFLVKKLGREFLVRVDEIDWFDTGDGEAKLHTDATVPVSRRFRQELRERLS